MLGSAHHSARRTTRLDAPLGSAHHSARRTTRLDAPLGSTHHSARRTTRLDAPLGSTHHSARHTTRPTHRQVRRDAWLNAPLGPTDRSAWSDTSLGLARRTARPGAPLGPHNSVSHTQSSAARPSAGCVPQDGRCWPRRFSRTTRSSAPCARRLDANRSGSASARTHDPVPRGPSACPADAPIPVDASHRPDGCFSNQHDLGARCSQSDTASINVCSRGIDPLGMSAAASPASLDYQCAAGGACITPPREFRLRASLPVSVGASVPENFDVGGTCRTNRGQVSLVVRQCRSEA